NAELYQSLKNRYPEIDFIAAGGVCTTDSIETLRTAGCHACVIGKAFYEDTTLRSAIVSLGLHKGAPSCLKK
ncbi:MAG: hypothetical protein KDK78_05315, partial [Chlamydiia bacterium]|nr:hypothetical protein [Chlamydiia bacterium]